MRFKKIYIEITNACNLNCSFCIKNSRKIIYMSRSNYEYIINKIKGYTKEIYLHILGEPLMHEDINYFIEYANDNDILVNITTNGYLINNINNYNIHRLNISIHSYNKKYKLSLSEYLNNIFLMVDKLRDKTFVTLRIWNECSEYEEILKYINKRYHTNIKLLCSDTKIKIASNLIIDTFHPFIWPDLNNDYYNINGRCLALTDHIGILSDGSIIPCCLDSKGILTLGNIYNDNFDDIFNTDMVLNMIKGFKNNIKVCELCRHCCFLKPKGGIINENN